MPVTAALEDVKLKPESALCLSGGGFRAMLFHVGTLWRLNEIGLLRKLGRISSVSGGSITAGFLGLRWREVEFDSGGIGRKFVEQVVGPLREFATHTVDISAVVRGALLPGTVGDHVAAAYKKHLFHRATLQDLPDRPRFVINATNVQSGVLWRFSKPYMADYRVGEVIDPHVLLATAVAASSAFPPFLSPVDLELRPGEVEPTPGADLAVEPFTTEILLTDGGVYDNLGLETVWKSYETVFVSDAGGKLRPDPKPRRNWIGHTLRVLHTIDDQVRSLRRAHLIDSYDPKKRVRRGAYWGIRTDIAEYGLADALPCPFPRTTELADVPTRLKRLRPELQERLINWGYAVCDAALRRYFDVGLPAPAGFPYPGTGV
jgi:NTE family protein